MKPEPSRKVVHRRARNRLMEVLEIAASFELQREVEPKGIDANELINMWEDWCPDADSLRTFAPGVLTADEVEALLAFHAVWLRVADATPSPLPSVAETQRLPEWAELAHAAAHTLEVLQRRGALPEE